MTCEYGIGCHRPAVLFVLSTITGGHKGRPRPMCLECAIKKEGYGSAKRLGIRRRYGKESSLS